ncbi:MAG: subclass B1 metallo-beta-lactamase, long type [Thermonemataceae bacterium]
MKKKILAFVILVTLQLPLLGQKIEISEDLTLTKISDHTYIHTQKNNNGIVYFSGKEAIIVSTPDSDTATQNLINWVENKAKIVAYVIDRWHPDAMQGLDVVNENNIKTYVNKRTKLIAQQKGLPTTQSTFQTKKTIKVGGKKVVCHYLGEAHTTDGIVVWIPSEKILFGGNGIRNHNGWVGNIGDANLQEWSNTAVKIKEHYGLAKIVVPGHGKHGSSALIDYTIELYDSSRKVSKKETSKNEKMINPLQDKDISVESEFETTKNGKKILTNAKVTIQDKVKLITIASPKIELQENKMRIDAATGRVQIYARKGDFIILRTDVYFNKLIVFNYDETVELVVILKEIVTASNSQE